MYSPEHPAIVVDTVVVHGMTRTYAGFSGSSWVARSSRPAVSAKERGVSPEPEETRVAIAGGTSEIRRKLGSFIESVSGVDEAWDAGSIAEAERALDDRRPEFLFLVAEDGDRVGETVGRVHPESVHVIVVLEETGGPEALDALKNGARGVIGPTPDRALIERLIPCVRNGELWAARDVLKQVLESAQTWWQARPAPSRVVEANGSVPAGASRDFGLTARELDIVRHVVDGRTNREIARAVAISENTVKFHLRGVYDKTGAHNRLELAVFAAHHSLVPPVPSPESSHDADALPS